MSRWRLNESETKADMADLPRRAAVSALGGVAVSDGR